MPKFDFSGNYVSVNNVKDGDVITITGLGIAEEKESAQEKVVINGVVKPKKYLVLNLPCEVNGVSKTYTPDPKTGLRFQEAWGDDYEKWIGKQFTAEIEEYTAYGAEKQRVIGFPVEEKK